MAVASAALKESDQRETVEAHYTAGIAYLLIGEDDLAVERLDAAHERARSKSAALLSDLSAAYLQRGRRQDRAGDLAIATNLAALAIAIPGAPLEAWFNRALALEWLGLNGRSRSAWQQYLDETARRESGRDEASWLDEAHAHLRRLERTTGESSWSSARERLDTGQAFSTPGEISRICANYPAAVREYTQDHMWFSWGRAILDQRDGDASEILARIRVIADGLAGTRHGEILQDLKSRVQSVGADSLKVRRLAAALVLYGDARRLYEANRVADAIPIFRRARRDLAILPLLTAWARLYEAVDPYLRAQWTPLRQALDRVIAEATQFDDPALRGRAWRLAGVAAATRGELAEALYAKRRAREDYLRAADHEERVGIDASLSETADMAGRYHESWALLRRAFNGTSHVVRGRREQALFSVAVWNSLRQGLTALAAEIQLELLQRAERRGEPIGQLEAQILAARLLRESGRTDEARLHLQRATQALGRINDAAYRERADFELSSEQALLALTSAPSDSVTRLTTIIDALATPQQRYRAPELLLARGRAHVRLGDFGAARHDFEAGLDIADQQSVRQIAATFRLALREARRALLSDLLELSIREDPSGRNGWRLLEKRRGTETYTTESDRASPILDPAEVQQMLDSDTAVVAYAVTATQVYGWFITARGYRFQPLNLTPAEIGVVVASLRRDIANGDLSMRGDAVRLYSMLLEPLIGAASLPNRLVLILDGPLHAVPFAMLQRRPSAPLVKDTAIAYAVSARALAPHMATRPRRVAALAVSDSLTADAPSLPEAREEARAVAAVYAQGRVLSGGEATMSALRVALEHEDVVHVASHTTAGDEPTPRTLLMRAGDTGTSLEKLPIRARLLVLSACSTAEGPDITGEGPRSLAVEFLQIGVPHVVGTLWSVRDRDARQFMTRFHAEVARGEDIAVALQRVQATLMSAKAPTASWAAYAVYVR